MYISRSVMDSDLIFSILIILSISMYIVNRDKIKKLKRSTKIDNIENKIRKAYNEIKNANTLFQLIIISCIIASSGIILIIVNIPIITLPFILIILDIFNINRNKDKNESTTSESETEFKNWEQLEHEKNNQELAKTPLKFLKPFMSKNPTRLYSIFGIFLGMVLLMFSLIFIMQWFDTVDETQRQYCQSYGIYYDSKGNIVANVYAPQWTMNYCEDVRGSFVENPNLRNLREYFYSPLNGLHYNHGNEFLGLDYTFWGHWNTDELGPNQHYYWIIYSISTVGLLVGILLGESKRINILKATKIRDQEKISMLTKLAKDPQGVVEGRINYPNQIEPLMPSKDNLQFAVTLFVLITIVFLISITSIFNGINNSNLAKNTERSIEEDLKTCKATQNDDNCYYLITPRLNDVYDDKGTPWTNEYHNYADITDGDYHSIDNNIFYATLMHGLQLSFILILFLSSMYSLLGTYTDENDVEEAPPGLLEERNSKFNEEKDKEEEKYKEEEIEEEQTHSGPISFEHVLKALGKELENARAESSALRFELDMTRDKVESLEIEVEEKNKELDDIQNVQQNMIKIADEDKKKEKGEGKSLSLMDSVLSGDVLFDSSKIDQQIINDPEAIAKAAINAYREGKKDSQE